VLVGSGILVPRSFDEPQRLHGAALPVYGLIGP
jgi:hypothetical protein